ncbi:DUF5133 domain-containing protein [Streptomyces sp. NPDC055749]
MLLAHPVVLWGLVREYEALNVLHGGGGGAEARKGMDDLVYALCLSTETLDVDAALTAARCQLSGPQTQYDSTLGRCRPDRPSA